MNAIICVALGANEKGCMIGMMSDAKLRRSSVCYYSTSQSPKPGFVRVCVGIEEISV